MAITDAPSHPNELVKVIESAGLADKSGLNLLEAFAPFFVASKEIIAEAEGLRVTDATQVTEIKKARELRLALRKQRTEAEKLRKDLKEDSLRTGRAIDNVAKVIAGACEPEEARLEEMEKFAERAEAARKAALWKARADLLRPFGLDPAFYSLAEMPEETFAQLLESTRLAHEAKIEEANRQHEAKLRADRERVEEEARVRAENERLRAEREEADRKAAAEKRKADEALRREREASEAKVRAEREAREKAEAALKAKADAEAKRAKAEAAAKRKAERAPDAVKLRAWGMGFADVPVPEVKSEDAASAVTAVLARRDALVAFITELSHRLEA